MPGGTGHPTKKNFGVRSQLPLVGPQKLKSGVVSAGEQPFMSYGHSKVPPAGLSQGLQRVLYLQISVLYQGCSPRCPRRKGIKYGVVWGGGGGWRGSCPGVTLGKSAGRLRTTTLTHDDPWGLRRRSVWGGVGQWSLSLIRAIDRPPTEAAI